MGLIGNLKDLNIASIIELNCVEKNAAQVTIKTRVGDAIVFFDNGEIVHARWGELKGVEALYRILRLTDGEFKVTSNIAPPERTIVESWQGLLLDGMRVLDETEHRKDRIARHLADELKTLRGVSRLLIVSKKGAVVYQDRAPDPEGALAIGAFLTATGSALGDALHFGPLTYASYLRGDDKEFVFDCDQFFVLLDVPRSADIRPTCELIEAIRAKLKSSDAAAERAAQPEEAIRP